MNMPQDVLGKCDRIDRGEHSPSVQKGFPVQIEDGGSNF